ncbi:hypothetical protein ACQCT6_19885 [Cytobacillus gottheilii]|nr:hypothetical protein [Cytobacillus gottheilii]
MKGRKEKVVLYSTLLQKAGILTKEDLDSIASLNHISLNKKKRENDQI